MQLLLRKLLMKLKKQNKLMQGDLLKRRDNKSLLMRKQGMKN
jgi:hypothetical protein